MHFRFTSRQCNLIAALQVRRLYFVLVEQIVERYANRPFSIGVALCLYEISALGFNMQLAFIDLRVMFGN